MNDEIFKKICAFVEKHDRKFFEELTRATTLERELYLTGFDAVDFIMEFSKEFNVDVSNFMAADYFADEGSMFVTFKYLFRMTKKPWAERKELTLGDLEKAVIAGKLDDTVIGK